VGDRRLPGERAFERAMSALPLFGARLGGFVLAHPRKTIALFGALLLACGALARSIPFDYDLLKFLPPGTESAETERDLSAASNFGADVIVASADNLQDARRKTQALSRLQSVEHVDSITSFVPDEGALREIAELAPLVRSIPPFLPLPPPSPSPTTPEAVAQAIERLADTLQMDALRSAATGLRKLPPDIAKARAAELELAAFSALERGREILRANVLDPPARPDSARAAVPAQIRARFEGASGKHALYIFPRGRDQGEELARFVTEVRTVVPGATGFPVLYFDSSRAIRHSFAQAGAVTLGIIFIALLLHFRSLRDALCAMVPLLSGALAMGGLMRLFSIPHNMANVVALPLLLGLGTDYGLQMVHQLRRTGAPLGQVIAETGLGVFLAGGTTAAGFGALTLARHLGARSLGLVLFLGTVAALSCALVLLPALLRLVYRKVGIG
jgi:uncharacterized membrane protein YdfJ with MMPL/SSD domain